jgi:hypothetical protein
MYMYLQKWNNLEHREKKIFIGVLKVTGEKSSIRNQNRLSKVWIVGSGSVQKCHVGYSFHEGESSEERKQQKNVQSDFATFGLENWRRIQILNDNISLLFYLFICLMDRREHGGQSVEILARLAISELWQVYFFGF